MPDAPPRDDPACALPPSDDPIRALLPRDDLARLRETLLRTGYTSEGIARRIGERAVLAARHGDLRHAVRATSDLDPLAVLIRLFVCERAEPEPAVAAVLPVPCLLRTGILRRVDGRIAAGVDLEPYGPGQWVVADLGSAGGPLRPDHVLGVGSASHTLTQAVWRRPVGHALDIGTGGGVQALHLSGFAGRVTATDVSARALRFAATTAGLSNLDWELVRGDLAAPVAGRRFDLVVSNPPFVVGPGSASHTYRDSGRPGDAVCAELAAAAPVLLNPGGTMQFLANWLHVAGEDWTGRVAGWVTGTGLDAWIVQREVADPVSYVRLWCGDAAQDPDGEQAAAWLDWFDARRVEAVGFGLVTLRRTGHDEPVVRVEELRAPLAAPLGELVRRWCARRDWLAGQDADGLLRHRFRTVAGVLLRQEAGVGEQGWAVDRQFLVDAGGTGQVEEVDPLVVALVGGCDGTVPMADALTVLAAAHEVAEPELARAAAPIVAHLVQRGFIEAAA